MPSHKEKQHDPKQKKISAMFQPLALSQQKNYPTPVRFCEFVENTNIYNIVIEEIMRTKHNPSEYLQDTKEVMRISKVYFKKFYTNLQYRNVPPLTGLKLNENCTPEFRANYLKIYHAPTVLQQKVDEIIQHDDTATTSKHASTLHHKDQQKNSGIVSEMQIESAKLFESSCNVNIKSSYPVSFHTFKRFTYHEHLVEQILRSYVNGDEARLNEIKQNKDLCATAMRNFYYAFYDRPSLRKIFDVKLKPCPAQLKTKILSNPGKQQEVESVANVGLEKKIVDIGEIESTSAEVVTETPCVSNDVCSSLPDASHIPIKLRLKNNINLDDDDVAIDDNEIIYSEPEQSSPAKKRHMEESAFSPKLKRPKHNRVYAQIETELNDASQSKTIATAGDIPQCTLKNASVDTNQKEDNFVLAAIKSVRSQTGSNKENSSITSTCIDEPILPVTLSEFIKYSNILKVVQTALEPNLHKELKDNNLLTEVVNELYKKYYLQPECRELCVFQNLWIYGSAPANILEIPKKIKMKETSSHQFQQPKTLQVPNTAKIRQQTGKPNKL